MSEDVLISAVIQAAVKLSDELESDRIRVATKDPQLVERRRAALREAFERWQASTTPSTSVALASPTP